MKELLAKLTSLLGESPSRWDITEILQVVEQAKAYEPIIFMDEPYSFAEYKLGGEILGIKTLCRVYREEVTADGSSN